MLFMVVAFCITVYFYDQGKYKVLKRQIEAIIFNHSFNKQAEYEKKVRAGKQKEKNYIFAPSLEKRQKGLTCGVIGNTSDFGSEKFRFEP